MMHYPNENFRHGELARATTPYPRKVIGLSEPYVLSQRSAYPRLGMTSLSVGSRLSLRHRYRHHMGLLI